MIHFTWNQTKKISIYISKLFVSEFSFFLGRLNSPTTINPPIMVHPLSPVSINGTSYHNRKVFHKYSSSYTHISGIPENNDKLWQI